MEKARTENPLPGRWRAFLGTSRGEIGGIFVLAALARWISATRTDPVAFDSAVYFEMARFFRAGAWEKALSYPYPPLFPLLVAGLEELGLATEASGLLCAFGLNLAVIVPLYFIARDLAGARAARAAAFLWAVHPYAIRLSIRALSDSPTVFFVALALWSGLYALESKKWPWAAAAGALSGLAYLSRPEGIEALVGLGALYLLAAGLVRRAAPDGHPVRLRSAWSGALVMGFTAVASPYVAFISAEAGVLTLSKKKSVEAMVRALASEEPSSAPTSPQPAVPPGGSPPAVVDPAPATIGLADRLEQAGTAIYLFQQPLVNGVYPVVLLLAVWGAIQVRRRQIAVQPAARALLVGLGALHVLILIGVAADQGVTYLGGHHFFLLVLYFMPFAGIGLVGVVDTMHKGLPNRPWAPAIAVFACAALSLPASLRPRDSRGAAVRAAGLWARDRIAPPRIVIADSAKFAFHAVAERIPLGRNATRAVNAGRRRGARFLGVYSTGALPADLGELARTGDLELVGEFPERPGERSYTYRIYRVRAVP